MLLCYLRISRQRQQVAMLNATLEYNTSLLECNMWNGRAIRRRCLRRKRGRTDHCWRKLFELFLVKLDRASATSAVVSVHPWANSKWPISQSEHALYSSYVITRLSVWPDLYMYNWLQELTFQRQKYVKHPYSGKVLQHHTCVITAVINTTWAVVKMKPVPSKPMSGE